MDKLIKKILTSKAHRNGLALTAFAAAAMGAGYPWMVR